VEGEAEASGSPERGPVRGPPKRTAARGIVTPRSKRRYRGVPQRHRRAESQLAAKGESRNRRRAHRFDTQADGTLPGHACPNDVSAATRSESRGSEDDRSASRIPTGTRESSRRLQASHRRTGQPPFAEEVARKLPIGTSARRARPTRGATEDGARRAGSTQTRWVLFAAILTGMESGGARHADHRKRRA
jgi:hypothetical protein